MKPGEPELREGWSIEAPNASHPLGAKYVREDNVVGKCCSAGVYREEDARLICAAPELLEALKYVRSEWSVHPPCAPFLVEKVNAAIAKAEAVVG
jgi:hypothetical protein